MANISTTSKNMSKNQHELTMVARKLLNMRDKRKSNYSADADDIKNTEFHTEVPNKGESPRQSKTKNNKVKEVIVDPPIVNKTKEAVLPRLRRRNSETFRAQYITPKEVRVCACTWNVGGVLPPADLDLEEWLDVSEPADIYVICFQEIIPLNAGNIFGVEDNRPVSKWETIIRETLNRNQPVQTKYKCYSDPPSPSKFEQSEDFPHIEDEEYFDTDSDEHEIFSANEEVDFTLDDDELNTVQEVPRTAGASYITSNDDISAILDEQLDKHFYHPKTIDISNGLQTEDFKKNAESSVPLQSNISNRLRKKEMAGLSWAEPPLDLLPLCNIDRTSSLRSSKSFKASKTFHAFNFFEPSMNDNATKQSDAVSIPKVDLKLSVNQKRRSHYVRIVSKQMVGLFVSIWVRRSLRKRIQNVNVSTVGVGAMGYMGNKGSISVSMSIYQTLFCFICTHLSAGEKEAETVKRNADVRAIHYKTHFNPFSTIPLPIRIYDHERIIWLGDLNYRLSLTYDETRQLIAKRNWSEMVRYDQLVREFKSGRTFDGWSEGTLNFPPTYKYEFNSEKYCGEDPKLGRRTPAWCDRIISFGTGMKLISYKSTDLRISDHRPVTASYMVEVEVFCPKKLQKALSYATAEFEIDEVVANLESEGGMSRLLLELDAASDRDC